MNRGKIVVNHAKNRYLPPDGSFEFRFESFEIFLESFWIYFVPFVPFHRFLPHFYHIFYHTFTIFNHIPYFFSTLEELLWNRILRVPDDHLYLYASKN